MRTKTKEEGGGKGCISGVFLTTTSVGTVYSTNVQLGVIAWASFENDTERCCVKGGEG